MMMMMMASLSVSYVGHANRAGGAEGGEGGGRAVAGVRVHGLRTARARPLPLPDPPVDGQVRHQVALRPIVTPLVHGETAKALYDKPSAVDHPITPQATRHDTTR